MPIVTSDEAVRLRRLVDALLERSTLEPGGTIASGTNTTGRTILFPGVNSADRSTYPAFWIRDPAWMAEAGLIGPEEVWEWVTMLCETMQGDVPRKLASGGIITPFSIADHINLDGTPVFYPGTYDSGESQGPPWGTCPPHDDQYWLTFTAHAAMTTTGDRSIGNRRVSTPIGELPLWLVCDLAHHAMPVDPETGCCVTATGDAQHQVDWGYNDTVTKNGKLLFPSLLRVESCLKLASLLAGCELEGRASMLLAEAEQLKSSIESLFFDESSQWLLSATGLGKLPDVWGSAFAVHRGYLSEPSAKRVALALRDAFRAGTTILDGQVRHIPTDYGYWPQAQADEGTYQNGGFWGYATGWYVSAVATVDREAAREIFLSYLSAMETGWRDDGEACAWECINPALDHYQNPGYVMTVAGPWIALTEAGLIEPAASS